MSNLSEEDTLALDEPKRKSVMIFGHNVAEIPCFRSSFLYGISGGMGIGFVTFLRTSRPRLASHVGFGSFMLTTICYWWVCRYQWSSQKFHSAQLKEAMKRHVQGEGTSLEEEILKKASSV